MGKIFIIKNTDFSYNNLGTVKISDDSSEETTYIFQKPIGSINWKSGTSWSLTSDTDTIAVLVIATDIDNPSPVINSGYSLIPLPSGKTKVNVVLNSAYKSIIKIGTPSYVKEDGWYTGEHIYDFSDYTEYEGNIYIMLLIRLVNGQKLSTDDITNMSLSITFE